MDTGGSGSSDDQNGDLKCASMSAISCSVCLEGVLEGGDRSIAKLQCGHQFHLDCIGSAFNAKGAMQCPNCRKVERGRWLNANGYRSLPELNIEDWVHEDLYDLPFGLQWCPFRGFTQLSSAFEEGEALSNTYQDLRNTPFPDILPASSSAHICPYLALNGFSNLIHHPPPSNGSDTAAADAASFHRHPSSAGVAATGDMLGSHVFIATEPRHHNWPQPSLPIPATGTLHNSGDQPASQSASRSTRNEPNGPQRFGSFVHPLPFLHGSASRAGNGAVPSLVAPPDRAHARGAHIYNQQSGSPPLRGAHFATAAAPSLRRIIPRGLTLISSDTNNPNNGFYARARQDGGDGSGSSIGRRFYGWAREGVAGPLPWIPIEGESQWWGPFFPSPGNPQNGGSSEPIMSGRVYFHHRYIASMMERAPSQGRQDGNPYQRAPHLARMGPFM
ncbi:uncharacterized protein LOC18434631 [Amborella trichopoda]|uniref:RING-type domain-containing protein n=1 Tax=Amborella trichopoda TaxID=13333 RepID=W1PH51_AMBTC|nr:uncharacterized protein LOC18434631 [Amborella trichopoda]XP_011623508.1 uncharacterized protein LOC18434631 [Amborella trichopoda]XP_011623509.1 uncharacterized protein LOC18434631 [Amborella trichopoda]ERN06435.1 hypothetical protein AMTR_s00016p00257220 [Amborella trichopoda]|eukprot:XP_006844760.1 uncharacterized protein LOC18434631 [Amborella trichopoda]